MAIQRCLGSLRKNSIENMARLVQLLALVCLLRQSHGFNGVVGLFAPAAGASRPLSSYTCFRSESPPSWRHAGAGAGAGVGVRSPRRRVLPKAGFLSPADAASERWTCSYRSWRAPPCVTTSNRHNGQHCRRRQRHAQRHDHDGAISRFRRRPFHPSPLTLSAVWGRGGSTSSRVSKGLSAAGEADAREGEGGEEGGDLSAAAAGEAVTGARRKRRKKNKKELDDKEKSVLGKAGDAMKATFNAFMAASTVVSIALAAEAFWQLHGTPLTLSNAVPTLTKLLPLTGIGVFGAAQLVGVVARVVRVIVTLPIMLSGTWVILQNAPKLLPQGSDLSGAGSLAALLATPEVLEAAAVLALLGGTAIWAVNFATGAVETLMRGQEDEEYEDDELLG